jgi:rubrerythrin
MKDLMGTRTHENPEIADWFETLAKAERSHAGGFNKALVDLEEP